MKKLYGILLITLVGILVAGFINASMAEYWKTISDLIPRTDNQVDIGSDPKRVKDYYGYNINLSGDLTAASSTLSGNIDVTGTVRADGGLKTGATYVLTVDETESLTSYLTITRANTWLGTKSTTDLSEGTNLYYTDARARASISETVTGLSYDSGTGVLSLTADYVIPTTTQETDWTAKADYSFGANNFNGTGNLTTTGDLTVASSTLSGNLDVTGIGTFGIANVTDETTGYQIDGANIMWTGASGNSNFFLGENAFLNSEGSENIGIGVNAGRNNDDSGIGGVQNIYIGAQSGFGATADTLNTGKRNVGIGAYTFYFNTTGQLNVGIGYTALWNNTEGYSNIGIGSGALSTNKTGYDNTGIGANALENSTSRQNTAVGSGAMRYSVGGVANTAIGQSALYNTSGHFNVGIGREAGKGASGKNFSYNVLIGYRAGYALTTGSTNVIIGYSAGSTLTTESNKLYIANTNTTTPLIYGEFDNSLLTINGNVGIGGAPTNALDVTGVATIGDGGTTNYFQIAADGQVTLVGDARVIKSRWFPFNALKAPGTKPATFKEWGISGVWEFADATDDTIVFNLQIPNDMDKTVAPSFVVGWSTNTTVTTETAVWQLEYLYTAPGEDTTAAAQETLTATSTAVAQANGLILVEITGMDLPGATDSCMHVRLKRLGADGNDDLTDTAELHGVCIKYVADKHGEPVNP